MGTGGTDSVPVIQRLALVCADAGWTVAAAESLTGGGLSAAMARGPDASDWFKGGLVAYATDVKARLLRVTSEHVVSEACACQMAEGVAGLLGTDAAVAVTGVGGPDPEDGIPAGTVFIATWFKGALDCRQLQFDGEPPDVVSQTVVAAQEYLLTAVSEA